MIRNAVNLPALSADQYRRVPPYMAAGGQQRAEAVSLVRLDGEVSDSILGAIRGIPAITVARLLNLE